MSDEKIFERSGPELLGIVKNVTGSGDAVAKKIATTFKALADKADWNASPAVSEVLPEEQTSADPVAIGAEAGPNPAVLPNTFRLHHDIHLHLPPTSDVGVYRAIFKAMKSELM